MSLSFGCHCEERKKPLNERDWTILQYKHHHSAFNGYRRTPSDYSSVTCNRCHAWGRTKAAWVDDLHKEKEATR